MSRTALYVAALAASAFALPASAAVVVVASNVDFSGSPFTFGVTPGDTFTLSYDSREQFDPSPVLVQTSGTAQVTTVFGAPSVAFTDPPTTFGPASFPGFGSVPVAGRASFTLTDSDLGLRYLVGSDYFYGYARFAGSMLESAAFESTPNTPILAGATAAVPEISTWAMMILGFGFVGAGLRTRKARMISAT